MIALGAFVEQSSAVVPKEPDQWMRWQAALLCSHLFRADDEVLTVSWASSRQHGQPGGTSGPSGRIPETMYRWIYLSDHHCMS